MRADAASADALPLRLHRDHLYIDAATVDARMPGVRSVALLRKADDLLILPISHSEAGGFIVKQVNARGDRAIYAADFFRLNGIDDAADLAIEAVWSQTRAAFLIAALFENPQTKFAFRK